MADMNFNDVNALKPGPLMGKYSSIKKSADTLFEKRDRRWRLEWRSRRHSEYSVRSRKNKLTLKLPFKSDFLSSNNAPWIISNR